MEINNRFLARTLLSYIICCVRARARTNTNLHNLNQTLFFYQLRRKRQNGRLDLVMCTKMQLSELTLQTR